MPSLLNKSAEAQSHHLGQLVLEAPELDVHRRLVAEPWRIREREAPTESLAQLKSQFSDGGRPDLSNACWCLEQVGAAQRFFLTAFSLCEGRRFYGGWCELEKAEIALVHLGRNCALGEDDPLGVSFLRRRIVLLQQLFPYRIFVSPGMVVRRSTCSVCKEELGVRSRCPHRPGHLYAGEMARRIISQFDLLELSMVERPVQKYSVGLGIAYDYALINYAVQGSGGPWAAWSLEIDKRRRVRPEFDSTAFLGCRPNESCPCHSKVKFKRCCRGKMFELIDHHQFVFPSERHGVVRHLPTQGVRALDDNGPCRAESDQRHLPGDG